MFTSEAKRFFADIAIGAAKLSGCKSKDGAVIVKGLNILSYGYNRKIIKNHDQWEVSAISDALFGAKNEDLTTAVLFSTKFPCLDDMKLIAATGIITVYFFGPVNDVNSVALINAMADSHIPLELIKLQ